MAKKAVKETSTALIFATVFFVLTTIAFGVMWYMEFSERDAGKAAVESAKKDVTAARGEATDAKLDSQVVKLYFGVDDEDDRKAVTGWGDKEKKRAAEAMKKFKQAVVEKVGKGDASKLPAELALWEVTDAGLPGELPRQSPLAILGDLSTGRDAAVAKEEKTSALYTAAIGTMKATSDALDKAEKNYTTIAAALPADFKTKLDAEIKKYEDRKNQYIKAENDTREEVNTLTDKIGGLERDKKKLDEQVKTLQEQVGVQMQKLQVQVQKTEAFINDQPQGKILRRLPEGIIEINIGADALVRPGLTFTVLPNDFPEKGRQSRMRVVRVQDEHGNYKNAERFIEKATIEVIEVVGPKLSRCRITQEFDPIRDGVAPGDLIYNAAWRKGSADHIALIGIFDVNGDGSDDIESVIRDLTHMGIPVDAYFDLKTRKWVGQITEQTRYVIEGWYPIQGGMDPNRDEKTKLIGDMSAAVKVVREKGVATVNFRDFFPRMGYRVKIDVPADKINQATAPYLNKVTAPETPMNPN